MGFLDKVKDLASKNADKVDAAIEKAGDLVDQKTAGKYADQVDKVQEAARKAVQDHPGAPDTQQPNPQQAGPQQPPVTPPPAAPPSA